MTYYEAYIHLLNGTGGAEAHEKAIQALYEMSLQEAINAEGIMVHSKQAEHDTV